MERRRARRVSIAKVAGGVAAVAGAVAAILALVPHDTAAPPTIRNSIQNFVNAAPADAASSTTSSTQPATVPTAPAPAPTRTFHTPSGNVSCAIGTTGVACSVASVQTTFGLVLGRPGTIAPGAEVGRAAGELVAWGSTVTVGAISCNIPRETQRLGVVCFDDTGHGFEASRVPARRKAY